MKHRPTFGTWSACFEEVRFASEIYRGPHPAFDLDLTCNPQRNLYACQFLRTGSFCAILPLDQQSIRILLNQSTPLTQITIENFKGIAQSPAALRSGLRIRRASAQTLSWLAGEGIFDQVSNNADTAILDQRPGSLIIEMPVRSFEPSQQLVVREPCPQTEDSFIRA